MIGADDTWQSRRAKSLFRVIDQRAGEERPPLLAVSIHLGVVPRDSFTADEPRADDLSNYKVCEAGDVVLNRMRAFQGAIGTSEYRGLVSPDYLVLRLLPHVDGRFLHYLFRSRWFVGEMISRLRGIGSTDQGNVRTPRINADDLGEIRVRLPALPVQRAIAGYLDAQTSRIDTIIARNRRLEQLLAERFESAVFSAVTRGTRGAPMRRSGLSWVDAIPDHWGTPTVSFNFDLQLGKMLSAEAAQGPQQFPYLRNVNVQWDRVDLDDLATMHFDENDRRRCALKDGDLLVCEGGEVGRAAVWPGQPADVFFQKAIHRVRPRHGANGRFLMYCLRAAAKMNVFAVQGNLSTIVHLTGEQLRIHRFPWPPEDEQYDIVLKLDVLRDRTSRARSALARQAALLQEHRQALVTAAVTGEFEIPGAAA